MAAVCYLLNGLVAMAVVAEVRMQVLELDLHLERNYRRWYPCHCLIYVSRVLTADRQRLVHLHHLRHRNHQGS